MNSVNLFSRRFSVLAFILLASLYSVVQAAGPINQAGSVVLTCGTNTVAFESFVMQSTSSFLEPSSQSAPEWEALQLTRTVPAADAFMLQWQSDMLASNNVNRDISISVFGTGAQEVIHWDVTNAWLASVSTDLSDTNALAIEKLYISVTNATQVIP